MKTKKPLIDFGKRTAFCCIFSLCLLMTGRISAQFGTFFQPKDSVERYVSVMMHLSPPYRPLLAEYADIRAGQFMVRLVLNDLSMRHEEVMVTIKLESQDIIWKSYSRPVSFSGKFQIDLDGTDFVPFFASINVPKNISNSGMLHYSQSTNPYQISDGLYRIILEISSLGAKMRSTLAYTPYYPFGLEDTPTIKLPKNKSFVSQGSEQNVLFQWMPRHVTWQYPDLKIMYRLELFVWQPDFDTNISLPVWTHVTSTDHYTLTADDYRLQPKTKYAWRVQCVVENDDALYFHDNGYSKISIFEYSNAP